MASRLVNFISLFSPVFCYKRAHHAREMIGEVSRITDIGDENGASLKRIVARLLIAMGKGIAYHWRGEKIAELQMSR